MKSICFIVLCLISIDLFSQEATLILRNEISELEKKIEYLKNNQSSANELRIYTIKLADKKKKLDEMLKIEMEKQGTQVNGFDFIFNNYVNIKNKNSDIWLIDSQFKSKIDHVIVRLNGYLFWDRKYDKAHITMADNGSHIFESGYINSDKSYGVVDLIIDLNTALITDDLNYIKNYLINARPYKKWADESGWVTYSFGVVKIEGEIFYLEFRNIIIKNWYFIKE